MIWTCERPTDRQLETLRLMALERGLATVKGFASVTASDFRPPARVKVSRKQWALLRARKDGPCRICDAPPPNELHHIVGRDRGGDDFPENLAPLCTSCHDYVERRFPQALKALMLSLRPEETAYITLKLGPNGLERVFGEAVLA